MPTRQAIAGFTLIEVMVIAPLIVLFIGGFIGLIVNLAGDALRMSATNEAAYEVHEALDSLEIVNERASESYPSTTGPVISPQGLNNSTTAFTVTDNDNSPADTDVLIIRTPATTADLINPDRALIRVNTPYSCTDSNVNENTYYAVTNVYFVAEGTLWQRTILPTSGTPCSTPWQRNSCAESQSLTGRCSTYDTKLVRNVSNFSVQYVDYAGATISSTNPSLAKAVNVSITVQKTIAGETINYTGRIRSILPVFGS